MENLATFQFVKTDNTTNLRGDVTDMAQGSRNLLPRGQRQYEPFEDLKPLLPLTGSRQMFLLRDGFAGLNDVVVSMVNKEGRGFVFSYIADSIWYGGQGTLSVNGVEMTGRTASNLLRAILKWNNSYFDAKSGPFLIGVAEPSTPKVELSDEWLGESPQMNGNYILQYARLSYLNGNSRASAPTSIFNIPSGKGLAVTVPLPTSNTNGHVFFISQRQSAGLGLTYRLSRANYWTQKEFTEEDIERTETTIDVYHNTDVFYLNDGVGFTNADIGKRVEFLTPGISVPDGTVIQSLDSNTLAHLSNNVTCVTTTGYQRCTAKIIAYANQIDRTVVLNWKETDLVSEESWIYDFPPLPCSHAFALGTRIGIICTADSQNDANTDQPGTAIIPTLRNKPESFDMRYPLFIEGVVVDLLSRKQNEFAWLGTKDGIYSIQEINSDSYPFAVVNRLQGEGIANPRNWAWSKNALYIASAKGKIVRLVGNGEIDSSFAETIAYIIRDWEQEDMNIVADPVNDGVILAHRTKGISLQFDEQTGRWSTALYHNDTYPGEFVSGIASQSKTYVSLKNNDDFNLYEWDAGIATDTVTMSPYVAPGGEYEKIIQRISAEYITDKINKTVWLGVHQNSLPCSCIGNVSGDQVYSPGAYFTQEMRGMFVLIRGAGATGGYHLARVSSVEDDENLTLSLSVPNDVTDAFILFARTFFPIKANRKGTQQIESPELFLNQLHSFALSMLIETAGKEAQALQINVQGHISGEQWFKQDSVWGSYAEDESVVYEETIDAPLPGPSIPGYFTLVAIGDDFTATYEESEGTFGVARYEIEFSRAN